MKANLVKYTIILIPIFLIGILQIYAQEEAGNLKSKTIKIGIKESKPFVIKNEDGSWSGISIELWNNIAEELQIQSEFEELDLKGLIDGLVKRKIDIAVAALTITPEREELVDFTHPFFTSGLGIALYAGCEYRELINRSLLRIINSAQWEDILYRYLGSGYQ